MAVSYFNTRYWIAIEAYLDNKYDDDRRRSCQRLRRRTRTTTNKWFIIHLSSKITFIVLLYNRTKTHEEVVVFYIYKRFKAARVTLHK